MENNMQDEFEIFLQTSTFVGEDISLRLQAQATEAGFDILPINAGEAKGHGITFSAAVLKASLPLWDGLPCFLDHDYTGSQSVKNLAGALHLPTWNEAEQGIQAKLVPGGPGAENLQALRLAARTDPALMNAVGFSAHLFVVHKDGQVQRITKVNSVDCVIDPARGGKFLQGVHTMKKKVLRNGKVIEVEEADILPTDELITAQNLQTLSTGDEGSDDLAATQQLLTAQKKVEATKKTGDESLRQLRLQTCRTLLKVSLESSKLPQPVQDRVEHKFSRMIETGTPFEPNELESAISEEQEMVSKLTAAGTIQGPGRITNMVTTSDSIEAAVQDLFGVKRDERLAKVKPARLTGIRELYLMLTGDYDLHGGYYGERVQLATTADFTGLVKNALNKIINNQWDLLGAAGYDWWKAIVRVEHFNSLNDITGMLVGTVGTLPTVAEGGEYTELPIGDSPEVASFVKYGGYIPLTLELIDRDNISRLTGYAKELGNATLRKYSALIAAVFTSNSAVGPTMADGGALFNATAVTTAGGHANLLTTAIGTDYTAWNAIALAMFNQPMLIKNATGYYGTGPKMAVEPKYCLVPRALKAAAQALFLPRWQESVPSIATLGGPSWGGQVVPVTVPDWTDATDYAAVIDPAIAPAIIVGERFGLMPEVYTAGNDSDPAVFMNDETRIKVRMFAAVLVQDFRPLHKENVAG
jgi:hypothetical protein